jgi:hypothetical protein
MYSPCSSYPNSDFFWNLLQESETGVVEEAEVATSATGAMVGITVGKVKADGQARFSSSISCWLTESMHDTHSPNSFADATNADKTNAEMEEYYKAQKIVPEEEWAKFLKHARGNLP